MWPFTKLRRSHWILLALVVLFLLGYGGLISWGRVEEALESLAGTSSGATIFQAKIDRADAIFIVFMFLMLTPIAVIAAGAVLAFVSAVLAGVLEAFLRTPGVPDWVFSATVYLLLVVVAYFTRGLWLPEAQGFLSLVARAVLAAYQ